MSYNSSFNNNNDNTVMPAAAQLLCHAATVTCCCRPTEAQLKWAQFHHKRVAASVKSSVRRLWLHPWAVADVDGAALDDGDTTTDDEDDDNESSSQEGEAHPRRRKRRMERPTISRGRRALLRVSQRSCEQRRRDIAVHGFQHPRSNDDDADDASSSAASSSDDDDDEQVLLLKPATKNLNQNSCSNNTSSFITHTNKNISSNTGSSCSSLIHDDDVASNNTITVRQQQRSSKKKRRRRWKQPQRCSDPERVRRFKKAFQAALDSLAASEQQQQQQLELSPSLPRKKWTRPNNNNSNNNDNSLLVPTTMHNDQENNKNNSYYSEYCTVWGSSSVPRRKAALHNPVLTPGKAPLDRSATWLQMLHTMPTAKQQQKKLYETTKNKAAATTTTTSSRCLHYNNHHNHHHSSSSSNKMTPELRQKVANVARGIFSGERNGGSDGNGGCSSSYHQLFSPESVLESDVASFVEQFERHILVTAAAAASAAEAAVVHPGLLDSTTTTLDEAHAAAVGRDNAEGRTIVQTVTYDSDEDDDDELDESSIEKDHTDEDAITTSLVLDTSFAFNASSSIIIRVVPAVVYKNGDNNCHHLQQSSMITTTTTMANNVLATTKAHNASRVSEDGAAAASLLRPLSPSSAFLRDTRQQQQGLVSPPQDGKAEEVPAETLEASFQQVKLVVVATSRDEDAQSGDDASQERNVNYYVAGNSGCSAGGSCSRPGIFGGLSNYSSSMDDVGKSSLGHFAAAAPKSNDAPQQAHNGKSMTTRFAPKTPSGGGVNKPLARSGCGLSSDARANHLRHSHLLGSTADFDIRWEKRLMM